MCHLVLLSRRLVRTFVWECVWWWCRFTWWNRHLFVNPILDLRQIRIWSHLYVKIFKTAV